MGITEDFSYIIKQIENFIEKAEAGQLAQLSGQLNEPGGSSAEFKVSNLTNKWYHSPKMVCNPYDPQYFDPKAERPPENTKCYQGPQGGVFYCGIRGIGVPSPKWNNDVYVTTHTARMTPKKVWDKEKGRDVKVISPKYQKRWVVLDNALKDRFHWIDWPETMNTLGSTGYQRTREGKPSGRKVGFDDFFWPKPMDNKKEFEKFLLKNNFAPEVAKKIAEQKENETRFHTHIVGTDRHGKALFKTHPVSIKHDDINEAFYVKDKKTGKLLYSTEGMYEYIRTQHDAERNKYQKDFNESITRTPYKCVGNIEEDEDCLNQMVAVSKARAQVALVGYAIRNDNYVKDDEKGIKQRRFAYKLINDFFDGRQKAIDAGVDADTGFLNEEEIKKFLHIKNINKLNPDKSDDEIMMDIRNDMKDIHDEVYPSYKEIKEFKGVSFGGKARDIAEEELEDVKPGGKYADVAFEGEDEEGGKDEEDEEVPVEEEEEETPVVEKKPAAKKKTEIPPDEVLPEKDFMDRLIRRLPAGENKFYEGVLNKNLIEKLGVHDLSNRKVKVENYAIDKKDAEGGIAVVTTIDVDDENAPRNLPFLKYIIHGGKAYKFNKEEDALNKIGEILKKIPIKKSVNIEKDLILNRIENLVNTPMPSPTLPVDNEVSGFTVFSHFQSGDNKVTLEGKDNDYRVCTNGIETTRTQDFREALTKYYSSVSRIIDTQSEDKDLGLELFGEHVINTARKTRKLMADLDKPSEARMLESLDYSEITLPFNPEFILKYEPQGDVFEIAPLPADSDNIQSKPEYGDKIGRKDIVGEEYHASKDNRKYQKRINEPEAQSPGVGSTGGVIIMRSVDNAPLNQPQLVPPAPIEAFEGRKEVVEKPIKAKNSYQQKLHPKEQEAIRQKRGVD